MTNFGSHNGQKFDVAHWARKQHFEFYKSFSQPYFNMTLLLETQILFAFTKQQQLSFFHSYLFLTLKAVNDYQPMSLRIKKGEVWQFNQVNANVVQLCDDDSFRISYLEYETQFDIFNDKAILAADRAKLAPFISPDFIHNENQLNTLHISVLPWLNFTSFTHATHLPNESGIPKLVFGQYDKVAGTMPLSIEVHHGLMDGVHVAKFVKLLQTYLSQPQSHLI